MDIAIYFISFFGCLVYLISKKSCLELEEKEITVAASLGFDLFTKPHLRISAKLKGNSFIYTLLVKSE